MNAQTHSRVGQAPAPGLAPGRVLQRKCACGQHTPGGGACDKCDGERRTLQRRPAGPDEAAGGTPPAAHEVLSSLGRALDAGVRALMESHFDHGFSGMRVHTDAKAAESARGVGALAYTVGHALMFTPGRYDPTSLEGRRLIAHELGHCPRSPLRRGTMGQQIKRAHGLTRDVEN